MDPITVEFALREDQFLRFQRQYFWRVFMLKARSRFAIAASAVLAAIGIYLVLRPETRVVGFVFLGADLGICLLVPWSVLRNARAQYRSSETLRKPTRWVIRDDGVEISGEGHSSVQGWETFHDVLDLPEGWFLMTSSAVGNFLPREAVPEADRERLGALMREKVPGSD